MSRIFNSSSRAVRYLPAIAAGLVAIASPAFSLGQSAPRVTEPLNESALVTLKGNTHPWARPRFDRGPVEDSHSGRMLMVLKRSPEQDKALRQLVDDQQNASSPNFHKWLTPEEFGTRFGVADADVQSVTGYLSSKGFTVGRVYKNKGVIEITGTAGQLRDTFHTQIHKYAFGGKEFYANASDPQIPAALAPVVRGFAALNNIQASKLNSDVKPSVPVQFDAKTHTARPQYTGNVGFGTFYLLAPADIQTIYNIPVNSTTLGNGGSGVTIGVIGDSQVNLNLVTEYQTLGGFGANIPVEIVDGSDPVIVPTTTGPDATIAYEQLELLSAVAPNANVNYYVSSTTDYDTGLDFAIIRAVEDDTVSVLTMGFQTCEANLTAGGNELVEAAWLQAAAQGITVSIAAGDTGSGGCDVPGSTATSTGGLAVNGYASTPYDTAVGGTDFYYTPLGAANYWNATNGTNYVSAKSYIPEQAWNDSIQTYDSTTGTAILNAGGGGFSTLGNVAADDVTESPYPVPSWQTNAQIQSGVAAPKARSIPDVSFFAGNGYNSAWYVICASSVDCTFTNTTATIAGGTAGSAAIFAGIMAEVVQKYGLQGNANPALYGLQSTTGVFHDTQVGSNSLNCASGTGCTGGTLKSGGTNAYAAGVLYDEATGLGSINASTLITDWKVPATASSATSLVIKNDATGVAVTNVVHGTALRLVATVTGSGTPTGNVAFTTGDTQPSSNALIAEPLVAGVATSADDELLPGGTYTVTARYAGDSTNLPSVGTYPITITPEKTHILNISSTYASGSSVPYGTTVKMTVEPFSLDNNEVAAPTGTMGFYNNSNDPMTILPLSAEGTATFSSNLLGGGQTYSLIYQYSGDRSYAISTTTTPYKISITQAATTIAFTASGSASAATPITLSATVASPASLATGVPPTGTVTFNTVGGSTVVNLNPGFSASGQAIGVATIQVTPAMIPPSGSLTGTYSSDVNYAGSTQNIALSTNSTAHANTTSLTMSLSSNNVATDGVLTLTVTASASTGTPSGTVQVTANGTSIGSFSLTSGTATNYTVPHTGAYLPFASGTVAITSVFTPTLPSYGPSSATANVAVTDDRTVGDFSVSTDVHSQTINSSSNLALFKLQVTAIQNFAGLNDPISLTCTVPGGLLNCSLGNNYVTVGNSGTLITTLVIQGQPQGGTGALHTPIQTDHWWMVGGGSALACVFILGIPARRKGWQGMMAALVCLVLVTVSVTGCGSSTGLTSSVDAGNPLRIGGGNSNASVTYSRGLASNQVPPGTYTVLITGTASSNTTLVHTTSITVVVNTGVSITSGSSFQLQNFYSGLVLDSNGATGSGTNVVQNAAVGSNNQKWTFLYQNNGYYLIKNLTSGLYLTDPGAQTTNVPITQQTLTGDGTQFWTLNSLEGGYEIVNGQSGGVLAANTTVAQPGSIAICAGQKNYIDGLDQTFYIQ